MCFCFFSLRVCLGVWSDFAQSDWIRVSCDSHFVQDFHLFMIKWYRHREIFLCNFHVCKSVALAHTDLLDWVTASFRPNQTCKTDVLLGEGSEGGSYLEIMCCMMKAGYVKTSKYGHLCVHGECNL